MDKTSEAKPRTPQMCAPEYPNRWLTLDVKGLVLEIFVCLLSKLHPCPTFMLFTLLQNVHLFAWCQ